MSHYLRDRIVELLMDAGEAGLSTNELAEQLDVTQQTIRDHFRAIEESGTTLLKEGVHYALPRHFAHKLFLRPVQMWLLYLPLRRLVRAQMQRYPIVQGLFNRIAQNLAQEIGDQISYPEWISPGEEPEYPLNDVFEVLVQGWQKEQWIRIKYRALGEHYGSPFTVAPWWFEPAVWSDSNYVLVGVQQSGGVKPMTLKLERIEWAQITPDTFQRPATEDILQRIHLTWGIWQRDGEPTNVVLRFNNRVVDRLKETYWHPSQELTLDSDGRSVLWRAVISEPLEMIPWIRGWGPDVEVLEPLSLREQIAQDVVRTMRLYTNGEDKPFNYF
jgi:predicted DNA-binding transcriptional regulator YafY